MPLLHLLLIALIQGLTEFLPVSSSGHLILLPNLTGLADHGQVIDVAVHVGTLGAVILYFREDVALALSGLPSLLRGRIDGPGAGLALCLAIATVPVGIVGVILRLTGLDVAMRSTAVIGWAMLIFGVVLYLADRSDRGKRPAEFWNIRDAAILGLWQAVALVPGTSRSGITITGARLLGYGRHGAAKLAMLMSIPTILASGILLGLESVVAADLEALRNAAIAALFAFGAALFALWFMMRLLRTVSFTPYVIYRILLGLALLWIAYS